ncbi:MAG: hypothetical protein MJK04_11220, partial [Psychrosphaera sp.]|nr:hypothetical protein [Psychrosphaera sp.]
MKWTKENILNVLDECATAFTFPVLDNGYVYLAATKMSVYRSQSDWAIVIEVFGFSPRAGAPDNHIYTFSSNLINRDPLSNYVSDDANQQYLNANPYNESRFVYPIENDTWLDEDDAEHLGQNAYCLLRGIKVALPPIETYEHSNIALEEALPLTFEFCRFLASNYREKILCNESERRISITPDMQLILQLDEWHHPDLTAEELPSMSETFQQIANVIETGT